MIQPLDQKNPPAWRVFLRERKYIHAHEYAFTRKHASALQAWSTRIFAWSTRIFYFGAIGFRVAGLNLQVAMQWLHSGQCVGQQ